jgi:RNA polymerase sigma-70 factor (ECF subfamily)
VTDAAQRFTLLYDTYHPRVYAYALSRSSRQVAEEIASATFLVAWERLSDVPQPALPWLLAVARNLVRTHYTRSGQQEAAIAGLAALAAAEPAAGDVSDAVIERATMLRALAALPAGDQEALTLVAWHGLTAREAATVLGCSRAAFFVRLHRARRRLQAAVEGGPGSGRSLHVAPGRPDSPAPHLAAASRTIRPGYDLKASAHLGSIDDW